MKLSEVKAGTPIQIRAFKQDDPIAEIWGKVNRTEKNESIINVYYYKGMNINLASPDYHLQAVVYDEAKEHEIDMSATFVKDTRDMEDRLMEKRDSFRIFISSVVDCTVGGEDTAGLLVDLSENGFKIAVMGRYEANQPVKIFIEDEEFSFSIKGKIVWIHPVSDVRSMCGCRMLDAQDRTQVLAYIQKKQQRMFEDLKSEIAKGKEK